MEAAIIRTKTGIIKGLLEEINSRCVVFRGADNPGVTHYTVESYKRELMALAYEVIDQAEALREETEHAISLIGDRAGITTRPPNNKAEQAEP